MPSAEATDVCRVLEWDSEFWGFPIARVEGEQLSSERARAIDAWCQSSGTRCLYFLAEADDPHTTRAVELAGFRFVDIRLTLGCDRGVRGSDGNGADGALVLRSSRPEDVPALRSIAGASHHDTRFYFDLNFPRQGCDHLYETWIERSCEGYADAVIVADLAGEAVGYITCHLNTQTAIGSIGLLGVSSRARGRGAGQMLVRNALQWFASREVEEINVVTQGRNSVAQRLYQRAGFRTKDVKLWYHKWYSGPGTEAR